MWMFDGNERLWNCVNGIDGCRNDGEEDGLFEESCRDGRGVCFRRIPLFGGDGGCSVEQFRWRRFLRCLACSLLQELKGSDIHMTIES